MIFKLENAILLFHYHLEDDIKKENATILKDGHFFLFSTSFSTFPGILNPGYKYVYEWQIYHMEKLHMYTYICYSYELHACKYDMIDI